MIRKFDFLYKDPYAGSLQVKEVQNYILALKKGFALVSERRMLTNNMILEIQAIIEEN